MPSQSRLDLGPSIRPDVLRDSSNVLTKKKGLFTVSWEFKGWLYCKVVKKTILLAE